MTKNYFPPHEIVANIFRAPSKIVKKFPYTTHIRSARVPGIKNCRSLIQQCLVCSFDPYQNWSSIVQLFANNDEQYKDIENDRYVNIFYMNVIPL